MRKILFAGITAVCVLMMGTTALAAETVVPRRIRAHGGCHQQLDSLWLKDRVRHDCAYVDADGDGICDNCSWNEDRHHCVDENGYCVNGSCNYENCGYAHGTGYCRGYCNSPAVDAVADEADSSYQEVTPADETNAGNDRAGSPQGNAPAQGSEGTASENGAGADAGSGYPGGYWGSGHHGGGHHGGGHHGCRY